MAMTSLQKKWPQMNTENTDKNQDSFQRPELIEPSGKRSRFIRVHLCSSVANSSRDQQLVAQHEARLVPRAGVDVLDAAEVRLVVLKRRVAVAGREELHHAEPRDDPVREVE
jgi:hypothetical protein